MSNRPSLQVDLAASGVAGVASTVGDATSVAVGSVLSCERLGPPQAVSPKEAVMIRKILLDRQRHVVAKGWITKRKLRPARRNGVEGQSPDDSMPWLDDFLNCCGCRQDQFALASARIYFLLFNGASVFSC
jgi:hypothetical protein